MTTAVRTVSSARLPLFRLLDPRERRLAVVVGTFAALTVAASAYVMLGWPLWAAGATFLATLLVPGAIKWRSDLRTYGLEVTVLSILVVAQGFHTIEHIIQWIQNHVLLWSLRASTGVLSPANAEWVHFVWNWAVLLIVAWLVWRGMRNPFAWILLAWTTAHTFEHTYLMAQHLVVLNDLRGFGISGIPAQGLPGILGIDGWLARSDLTQGTFLCRIPLLTTATRLDIHFWWNIGEVTLLLLAANSWLRSRLAAPDPAAYDRADVTTPEGGPAA